MPKASSARLPGDWDGLVVFCAGTDWDGNMFPDQHMAQRLAAYAPVLYVDPPRSVLAGRGRPGEKLTGPRLRSIGPGMARLTPVGPPAAGRRGVRPISDQIVRADLRRAMRALGRPAVHAVVAASFAPVFGACGERRRVFYSTDDFVAGAELMKTARSALVRHEERQLADVDTVVVCSPGLEERYRARGLDPVLIPNGCDDALFRTVDDAPWPDDVDLPRPIVGFVGHLTDRIDWSLLEAVAARGRSLLLVGNPSLAFGRGPLDALLVRPNVQWVGAKPFHALPGYLRAMDVGLLPYGDTEFNRGSFPLKVLEYLAAGRGAVSTGLPAVRWLETDLIDVADDPEAFADAVDRALDRPRTPELVAARQALAAQNGWDRRAAEMARAIGLDVPA